VAPAQSFGLRPGILTVNPGKSPRTMFRTDELVLDEDVAPEGLNETFQLLSQPHGALDQVKLHAFQWTFAEVSNQQDGWTFGGQVNPSFHLGNLQLAAGPGQDWGRDRASTPQALSR